MKSKQSYFFAYLSSLVLHAAIVAVLLFGVDFHAPQQAEKSGPEKEVVQATMVDQGRVEAAREKIRQREQEQQKQEALKKKRSEEALANAKRKRQEEEKKAQQAKQKREQEEKKAQQAAKKRAAEEKKKQQLAQQRAQEEAAAKAAEVKRKAEEKKAAELKAKREREEQLRKEKAAAEKRRLELEQQMLAEMAAEEARAAKAAAAREKVVMSEVEKYRALISNKVNNNWIKPQRLQTCVLKIKIGPGGMVLDVAKQSGDEVTCQTATTAVYKSAPLPIPSDPEVFNKMREISFTFKDQQN